MTTQSRTPDELARERAQKLETLRHREEERSTERLAGKTGLQYRNLKTFPLDGAALTLRPIEEQQKAQAAIVHRDEHQLAVGTPNPGAPAFQEFRETLEKQGFRVTPLIVSRASLTYAWSLFPQFAYLQTHTTGEVAISQETIDRFQAEILDIRNLATLFAKTALGNMSVVVELLLAGALRLDASDIHVEPLQGSGAKLRYRLDGLLHDLVEIQRSAYHFLLERIKLLSGLKLNVTHRGQDGRFSIHVHNQTVDVRVSTLPGPAGEFIVLRLLNPKSLLDIAELGLRPDLLAVMEEELKRPNGMILTTGPTGSGKTTMLYAFLKRVTSPELKVITIEDPIEYRVSGIEQTQVDLQADYTFASGLRSIVRQDPDIVLVGEIRDTDTATTAVNAALTGHLVFSTLHTNDAAGALPRLIEMDINPSVLGPALNVVMAQRLIRRVCDACSKLAAPEKKTKSEIQEILRRLPKELMPKNLGAFAVREADACARCHHTGYRGRIGIFELFRVDEAVERLALRKPAVVEIRTFAIEHGMVTLQQDALLRVIGGITTVDEVIRVTGPLALPPQAQVPLEPHQK